ncbi:unnamed protein product [Phytophthora fragariaefolia]|uniref:Unnamed protein product n=1 Tax=Phytophthora fragariaefolia TaxID=1490495 RepID=A0A9W7CXX4_9STRA|nr:unnamed protein product [Phytophthora fragariaefolia]
MAVDQFGLVRCGDILRVMKTWIQNRRQERPETLWEIVGNYFVVTTQKIEKKMNSILSALVRRTTKALGSEARRRTTVAKNRLVESLRNFVQAPDSDDGELQWSVTIRVGGPSALGGSSTSSTIVRRAGGAPSKNIRFRMGIHPPSSTTGDAKSKGGKAKSKEETQLDYDSDDSQPDNVDEEVMCLVINFLLNPEISGNFCTHIKVHICFIIICIACWQMKMELIWRHQQRKHYNRNKFGPYSRRSGQNARVRYSGLSFRIIFISLSTVLNMSATVSVHSEVRTDGSIEPLLGKYLRVCIYFREDFVSSVEVSELSLQFFFQETGACNSFHPPQECTGTSFAAGIRSFFVLSELDLSLMDIINASRDMGDLLHNLGKRQNRERAMRMIFDLFDADHSGTWSLQKFNAFQQALGKEALLEGTVAEIFGGVSTISFEQFVETYASYPATKLLEVIRQLGIGR